MWIVRIACQNGAQGVRREGCGFALENEMSYYHFWDSQGRNGDESEAKRKMELLQRLLCMGIGYLFGSFLTAELVARIYTGKKASEIGSGNPGMANILTHIGKKAGALVLAGDILKTALACTVVWLAFGKNIGTASLLWAGMGATLGHNFPAWGGFHGGKGVAVTCTWLTCYLPGWGLLCCIAGGAAVLISGYLPLGAVLISVLAVPLAFWQYGPESGICMILAAMLMFSRHYRGLIRIAQGTEERFFHGHKET
jgi:glycerol-3-phosphate acyltransferase PlsY